MHLSVNLSPRSVDMDMLEVVRAALEADGGDPERLTVEITETAAIADLERAQVFADALRAMGVRLALDDFGAGFASFQHLTRVHFDEIKIDGEYVRNLADDETHQVLVRSLVDLARGLGKEITAEFVSDDRDDRAAALLRRALGPGLPPRPPGRARGAGPDRGARAGRDPSVGRRPRAVARKRLVAQLLAAVPEPVVQRPRRHAQPWRQELAGVHGAGADLPLGAARAAAARRESIRAASSSS